MKEKDKKYDCRICPYVSYRDDRRVFCGVCLRSILEGKKKVGKEVRAANG